MNRSMNFKKSYRLCTLSPVRKSSITMTSSELNESGQHVMFVHFNNFALSLIIVENIVIIQQFCLQSQGYAASYADGETNLVINISIILCLDIISFTNFVSSSCYIHC